MQLSRTTTAFQIEGFRVVRNLGVVRGITVRSRSIFGTIGASLETIVGGNITLFTELCENTRSEAFSMMVDHAEQAGATGLVLLRADRPGHRGSRLGVGAALRAIHAGRAVPGGRALPAGQAIALRRALIA